MKKSLKDLDQFKFLKLECDKKFKSSYYCASIILKKKLANKRFEIIKKLKNFGIGTSIHYPKIVSDYSFYKKKYKINAKKFPNASIMSYRSINLPVGPHLKKKDLIYIISKIKNVFKNYK